MATIRSSTPVAAQRLSNALAQVLGDKAEQTRRELIDYFTGYTGRYFDHYSVLADPNKFDANDVAAVACLSVPLSGRAVAALADNGEKLTSLLKLLPSQQTTIWDVDPSSVEAASQLYWELRKLPGVGKVRASKLLASKRPALIPIRDSVVENLLGDPNEWWTVFASTLDDGHRSALAKLRSSCQIPDSVTELRVIDVALWQYGQRS